MRSKDLTTDQLQQLSYHLSQKKLDWNQIGTLISENVGQRSIRRIFGREQASLVHIAQFINQAFVKLEEKGVKIFAAPGSPEAAHYRSRFTLYFNLSNEIKDRLQKADSEKLSAWHRTAHMVAIVGAVVFSISLLGLPFLIRSYRESINEHWSEVRGKCAPSLSRELKKVCFELECQEVALRYRIGAINGGLDKVAAPDPKWVDELTQRALEWKKRQPLAIHKDSLNQWELLQLSEAARYPDWLRLVRKNPVYAGEVFNWILRDFDRADVLIAYRNTQLRVKEALIAGYIGKNRTPGQFELLDFQDQTTKVHGVFKRVLTLPIWHKENFDEEPAQVERINILKPSKEVTFQNGNFTLSVDAMFKEIGNRNAEETRINLCARGLINYHSVKGVWHTDRQTFVMPAGMTRENLHRYLPPGKIWTNEEMERRHGNLAGRTRYFKIASTKQDDTVLNCHSNWKLFHRLQNGNWAECGIGMYLWRFQQGAWDGLRLFCDTGPRVLTRFDQMEGYTHRQFAAYAPPSTDDSVRALQSRIYDLMLKPGVFQLGGDNCTMPVQKAAEEVSPGMPNLFRMRVSQAKLGFGLLDKIFSFLDKRTEKVRRIGLAIIRNVLGGFRSCKIDGVKYSLNSYYRNTEDLYHPGYLVKQVIDAKKSGVGPLAQCELSWGNSEARV